MQFRHSSKILFVSIFATLLGGLCAPVWAEPPERPQEIDKTYTFEDRGLQGFGAEANADIMRLDTLFGTAADWSALHTQLPENQDKGWLGIAMKLPAEPAREPGTGNELPSIEIARIMPASAADIAGLHEADLILGIDGTPIADDNDKKQLNFRTAISRKRAGEKVSLRILRDKEIRSFEVTLGAAPRTESVLKPHPELEDRRRTNAKSLLKDVLEKEGLEDEFVRLLGQFRNETDKVVSLLLPKPGYNPFRLQEVNYVMNHPLDLPVVARRITDELQRNFDQTQHDLAGLLHVAMGELDMDYVETPHAESPPASLTRYIERLVGAIQHANSERSAILSALSPDEVDFLYAYAPTLLTPGDDPAGKDRPESEKREEEAQLLKFFQIVLRMDLPRLMNATAAIARAVDLPTLAALDRKNFTLEGIPSDWTVHEEDNLTVIDTPAGRVLIGGPKNNIYAQDAALILDLGGNDTYLNHAGGSTRAIPFAVVIDLSGDDSYSAQEDFSQGAGMLGGGFLVDLEGNDRYTAKNHSQGSGILGVGVLADLAGNDRYSAITNAQGAGSFGIGILAEGGGSDAYYGNLYVQGFGFVKGFGAIVEAAGNDSYFAGGLFEDFRAPEKSYQAMSQGFGFGMRPVDTLIGASGGIGVIAEAEGNDTYVSDYFSQGSSYWFALGILDDRKGNDRYVSGRYSQGAGIHMSAGILIDGEGDDNYIADFGVAQGCGHDFGIGFLVDNGGNDRYIAGTLSQGAGNDNGIGVLSDNGGDDTYILKERGQGHGNFEPARDLGSFGFLFDTGGTDFYSRGGTNDSLRYKTQWGILVDTK